MGLDENAPDGESGAITGELVNESAIERLLQGLSQAPLGLSRDVDFRISVAGAQEKTALLRHKGQWWKPSGTTPTTHIFKKQIGRLPDGIDLSNSVENEFYCLRLAAAFGLPVTKAEMQDFNGMRALVVERFDRRWTADKRLLRMPQEDFCQVLSVPPTRKYQSEGGPGLIQMLEVLRGSDSPTVDRETLLKAQIFFWLIGATDGHAKNFSIFLGPGGSYRLTPLYDVLTAQPSLEAGQVQRKQMKLSMSVGTNRHYRIDEIQRRHFVQTALAAGLSRSAIAMVLEEVVDTAPKALETVENALPNDFPTAVSVSVSRGVKQRLDVLVAAP